VRSFFVAAALCLLGCAPKLAESFVPVIENYDAGVEVVDAGPQCGCELWGNPRNNGLVPDPLVELSGLAASRSQPGVFFAHNDSGDSARFFSITQTGQLSETYTLSGATAVDWEDIALGPCPRGTCVFIGDIGDNLRVRNNYAIYSVVEPIVGTGNRVLQWERYGYEYPGGAKHNSESLFVHPFTGRVYLVTKEDVGGSEVYRFPLPLSSTSLNTLEKVVTLTIPGQTDRPLTAADVNPCGTGVLMRMYNRLVEFRLPAGETDFERIFSADPVTVPIANEAQGEAVTYGPDGRTYFTASEKLVDVPPLYEYRCR